jgi:hypothetical protein
MGIRHHPLLIHIKSLLSRDPDILSSNIESIQARTPVTIALQKLDMKIAKSISIGHKK